MKRIAKLSGTLLLTTACLAACASTGPEASGTSESALGTVPDCPANLRAPVDKAYIRNLVYRSAFANERDEVKDAMVEIAQCESPIQLEPRLNSLCARSNNTTTSSHDYGLFQINYPYEANVPSNIYEPAVNVAFAYDRFHAQGLGAWQCFHQDDTHHKCFSPTRWKSGLDPMVAVGACAAGDDGKMYRCAPHAEWEDAATGPACLATRYFPETKQTVSGSFLAYWNAHGGLAQQGYPISYPHEEKSDTDGQTYEVQYFERAVFERHASAPPFDVLLQLLGVFRYQQRYPNGAPNQHVSTASDRRLFPETGKSVGGRFLRYWNEHGGLAQQGFPISEEMTETSETDGRARTVQYFERAVFELHPENAGTPYDVLLSQLGRFRYEAKGRPGY